MNERLSFFLKTIQCTQNFYYWKYSTSGELLEANSDDPLYDAILRQSGFPQTAEKHPLILINEGELMWSIHVIRADTVVPAMDAIPADITVHALDVIPAADAFLVLGPFFPTVFSLTELQRIVEIPQVKNKWKESLIVSLKEIPAITVTDLIRLSIQLHFVLSGEKIPESGIQILKRPSMLIRTGHDPEHYDCTEGWIRDNNLCEIIRNGDKDYQRMLPPESDSLAALLRLMYPAEGRGMEQIKQQITIEAGLCIRAAIDGGLTPTAAYQRGSLYLTGIRHAMAYEEMLTLLLNLCEALIAQVYEKKQQPQYSELIERCMDYIEDHIEDPLSLEILADRMNYSKYYLSKRFKAETGESISSRIKAVRIQKSCYLLTTTGMSIQQISDLLHFGNRNFFTRIFKEQTGKNPAEYRTLHTKKRPEW